MNTHIAALSEEDKEYDELEVDLTPGGGHDGCSEHGSRGPSETSVVGHSGGAGVVLGSARRSMPRGERCGRCFRRRIVRVTFRLVNVGFAVIFLASAVLQYNDSDGILWAAVYFAAAVFSILSELSWRQLRTYFVLPTLWLFTACTTIGALYILVARLLLRSPEGGGSGSDSYDFWGLALVSFWMSMVLLLDRYNVVGVFRGYTSLSGELERDKEGHVQMGEVVI